MVATFDLLAVCEIVRPTTSGMTEPFQCRLEDDELYAVKGRGALARGLLAEMYAAELGRSLGLPIPNFVLASVSRALIEVHPDPRVASAIGVGTGFASQWQEPVENLTMPLLPALNRPLLAKVYVFDHWIMNSDRTLTEHGGNSNLLVRLSDRSLVVIDHNLAFSTSHSAEDLRLHACRQAWMDLKGNMLFKPELLTQMQQAMTAVSDLHEALPDEWLEAEPTFPTEVSAALNRVNDDVFWDELG